MVIPWPDILGYYIAGYLLLSIADQKSWLGWKAKAILSIIWPIAGWLIIILQDIENG